MQGRSFLVFKGDSYDQVEGGKKSVKIDPLAIDLCRNNMAKQVSFVPLSLSPLSIGTSHNRNISKGLEKDRLIEWMVAYALTYLFTHPFINLLTYLLTYSLTHLRLQLIIYSLG